MCRICLCITLCSLVPARAATIIVTTDSGGVGGPDCTLRDAITTANTDSPTGGCPAGNGADTIELPVGATITLTEVDNDPNPPASATGLPSVTSVVTINGNGTTIRRDDPPTGGPSFRIIRVAGDGDLTVNDLTISDGSVNSGGGILNSDATLTLNNSAVSGNRSFFGGGIFNTGTLTLTNSTINGNTASACQPECFGVGGGIWNNGTVTLTNSTIGRNFSDFGGGINNGGTLTLTDSIICGNTPDQIVGGYTDGSGNLVADDCPPCVLADLTHDREVSVPDLVSLLGAWGPCPGPCAPETVCPESCTLEFHADFCPEDLDGNCEVRVPDLIILLAAWGPCPFCGDLVVDPGEQCDPPNGLSCDLNCQLQPTNCCFPHIGFDGCADPICESAVCGIRPSCCDTEWDEQCAAVAAELCPECHGWDCCFAHGSPGCTDPDCEEFTCIAVPFCCVFWFQGCVDLAAINCPQCDF